MNKEEILFQNRLQDLAQTAYQRCRVVFSDFLSMNELSILHGIDHSIPGVSCNTNGGYELAERQMACFVPDAFLCEYEFPIAQLKIEPSYKKSVDLLTHRDYLGALLNLGIDRSKVGDIVVDGRSAYVFCSSSLTQFFLDELTRVKHTVVKVSVSNEDILKDTTPAQIKPTVASLRADSIIAAASGQSRSNVLNLFRTQKVFVNGRLTESNSHLLKEGDIISVRGYGRYCFREIIAMTKKNRYLILIDKY